MPEEIKRARMRRLRDFTDERLTELIKHHRDRAANITYVLNNPNTKEPRYRKWEPMRRERLQHILANHLTMVAAIKGVLEERKEER